MEDCGKVNICRACLAEEGEFQTIFGTDEESGLTIHLAEIIMAYTSLQITLGDGLPDQICSHCAKTAVHFYLFKQQCEESDANLRQQLLTIHKSYNLVTEQQRATAEALSIDPYLIDVVIKPEIGNESEEHSLPSTNLDESFDVTLVGSEHETDVVESSHLKQDFMCNDCNKYFTDNSAFLHHQATHDVKTDLNLSIENVLCDDDDEDDDNNEEEKFKPMELKCVPCNIEFINKSDFISHISTHDSKPIADKGITCHVCNKSFSKCSHLTRHLKIHDTVKAHMCKLCDKGFARAEQFVNHMNAHSGKKPHVCTICNKGFNQISNLRDHMRTHNGEKPFLCSTCGKGFNQLGNLRQHIVRHSGIKAHLCSTCGNGFASKGELCAHVRKHTGARPFVCPICNHGFTTSSSLTKHKRIHSGEKPYECDVCKMKFSRSGILARHKRTHTGEKPYVCIYCAKAFSQSNDLSSHLRIHTGEKPYICDSCGQAFRQSSALKSHKKTHIERTPTFKLEPPRNYVPIAVNAVP